MNRVPTGWRLVGRVHHGLQHGADDVEALEGSSRLQDQVPGHQLARIRPALVRRGDLTLWFTLSAIRTWTPLPTGQRGGQPRYSDPCIELALTLKLLFGLPWRSVEGLLGSLLKLAGIDAPTPDHTTLSRRTRGLDVQLRRTSTREPVHLVVDATGLGIVGQGQWAAAKWGERGRRGWRKLHVALGEEGGILAVELTDASVADATALPGLLEKVPNRVKRLTADGGYDRREVYEAARKRGATTVIPPRRDAVVSCAPVLSDRDAHIERIGEVGRRRWRLEAGQHHQSRAENTFYRYKRRFGDRLSGRNEEAQRNEVLTACNILNKMTELGMPVSRAVPG